MLDQADDLRRLTTQRECVSSPCAVERPTILVVTGGKGGVGTTTIAVRLANSLTLSGRRTLLIDADPRGGNAAMLCGVEEQHSLADVLAGRRNWAEAIETSPNGVRLIAGTRWSEDIGHGAPVAAERLIDLLSDKSSPTDVAVIDAGNTFGRSVQSICRIADAVVVVATPETAAVVGAFATIRSLAQPTLNRNCLKTTAPVSQLHAPASRFHILVNMAKSAREAKAVHARIARACRRLLGIEIVEADWNGLVNMGLLR
jgi:flagellar biosynthesis protein FlhG